MDLNVLELADAVEHSGLSRSRIQQERGLETAARVREELARRRAEGGAMKLRRFDTKGEAVQYSEAAGGAAILLEGHALVVDDAAAEELGAGGLEFAYIIDRAGRLMTVPVND